MSVVIENQESVAEGTVVLSLELGKVTTKRTVSSNTEKVDTEIDRNMLHLSVDLFDAPEQKKCQSFLTKLKAAVKHETVPSFFRGGFYLVKLENVEAVDKLIEEAIEEFKPVVKAFADVVDQRRDEGIKRTQGVVNLKHYPSREQVLAAYRIEKRWLTLGTPQSLKQISAGFFEKEKQRSEESFKTAGNLINQLLAVEAKGLTDHLIERLTPGPDGKTPIFRDKTVLNITEFLAKFNLRSIGTTEELNKQIEKMRQLLNNVDPKSLRDSDDLKASVRKGFEQVRESLDKLVAEPEERLFDFSEVA